MIYFFTVYLIFLYLVSLYILNKKKLINNNLLEHQIFINRSVPPVALFSTLVSTIISIKAACRASAALSTLIVKSLNC